MRLTLYTWSSRESQRANAWDVRSASVDVHRIAELRTQGAGWKNTSRAMRIGVGTLYRPDDAFVVTEGIAAEPGT
jgi:hypothetical protein